MNLIIIIIIIFETEISESYLINMNNYVLFRILIIIVNVFRKQLLKW